MKNKQPLLRSTWGHIGDVYDFMLFFNKFLYENESFREYHKIIDVPYKYHSYLARPLQTSLYTICRRANSQKWPFICIRTHIGDVYDFMLFFNKFLYEKESFREYHKIIDVPYKYPIFLNMLSGINFPDCKTVPICCLTSRISSFVKF